MRIIIGLLSVFALSMGCAPKTYHFSLSSVAPKPAGLMMAKKNRYPLYLVLDPQRMPAEWTFKNARGDTAVLGDFGQFVKRDLKNALGQYFREVKVVASVPDAPGPHWAADVQVDRVEQVRLVRGPLTYLPMQMKWQFALRGHQAEDYVFTYGGTATSLDTYRDIPEGAKQTVEAAIESLTKAMVDKGVLKALRAAEESGQPPAPLEI